MCISFNQTNVGLFFMPIIVDYWLSFLRLKVLHAFIRESEWLGTCDPKDDQEKS